jgi:hypothetical protein
MHKRGDRAAARAPGAQCTVQCAQRRDERQTRSRGRGAQMQRSTAACTLFHSPRRKRVNQMPRNWCKETETHKTSIIIRITYTSGRRQSAMHASVN